MTRDLTRYDIRHRGSLLLQWCQCVLMLIVGLSFNGNGIVLADVGDGLARESLQRQSFPWYDSDSGQVVPVELNARDAARSLERNQISKHTPPPATTTNWNWNWDWSIGEIVSWVFMAVGIAVLIAALVWAFRNIDVRSSNGDEFNDQAGRTRAESIAQLPFRVEAEKGDFKSLAAAARQTGDFRQAIIYLFSHTLVALDQGDLIRLKKGKTNRQYLRELSRHRELASFYEGVMLPFEASFFGDHQLTSGEFEICWNRLNGFHQSVAAAAGRTVR